MFKTKNDKPENYISNHHNELIVRGSAKRVIFLAICLSVPCLGLLTDSLKNWLAFLKENYIVASLLILLLYGSATYFWIKVFDKKVKLIINEKGLWYKKTGFIKWPNLWYYYIKESKTSKGGKFYSLILKIRDTEEDTNIDITYFDKKYEQIQEAIKDNSEQYGVNNLGFETTPYSNIFS